MPKPRGKRAGRRPGKGKGAVRARRPKPKARGAKPAAARKAKPVAAKKKKVGAPAKPARRARKPKGAVPRPEAGAPKPTPPIERKEEGMAKEKTPDQFLAEVLTPEFTRETGHMCWDCKHFKPVIKGSKFPPADTIGWCAQIHWPFFWCVTDFNCVKKCYAFEKGVYAPFQPARFEKK